MKCWQERLHNTVAALLATKNEAIVYFTRRDLLGETVGPIGLVWEFPEPRKILSKQRPDGSWPGPVKRAPIYPEDHTHLAATFRNSRTLIERYQFTRESVTIEKAADVYLS